MNLDNSTERIATALADLTKFNTTPGNGVTRFPFTNEAREASAYLRGLMEEIGLQVHMDNSGAIIGRLEGQVPDTVMTGSHLDSVQHGGAYDCIAGLVSSIEALRIFN